MLATLPATESKIELRPYQRDILRKVVDQFKEFMNFFVLHTLEEIADNEELQRQLKHLQVALVVLPTGGGKTIIFSACEIAIREILQTVHDKALNTLIIAHRQELLSQARDKYHMLVPDMPIGLVGDGTHGYGHPITVASIQTISQQKHINTLKTIGYDLIIIDECHHSQAATYKKVLQALPNTFVLMVTATPDRLDGKPVVDHPPICSYSIIDMIKDGYLCNLTPIAIRTQTDLSKVGKTAGDYNKGELAEAVDSPRRNQRIAESYMEHAAGRQALCFAVTVKHAYHLAQAFQAIGVRAEVVTGETSSEERARLLKDYEDGRITVLVNVGVLTEGYDDPGTSCIVMARPTQSRALFVQCVGRGLRLAPGKGDCVLLDITDNVYNHRIEPVTLSKVFNKTILNKESVLDALEREEKEEERRKKKQEELDRIAQERIIRQKRRTEDAVINLLQKFEWTKNERGYYILEIGEQKHRIALIPDSQDAEMWRIAVRLAPDYQLQWLYSTPVELGWAQAFAEQKARKLAGDTISLQSMIDQSRDWRNHPASAAQVEKLDKWKVNYPKDENGRCLWTKGEASDAMDKKIKQFQKWGGKRVAK